MGNVIILDENTANRIAAGEVIERPASVVKELVENSIDAGATKIAIDIKKGGIASIIVSDDGEGFYGDDVLLAFERYATSKLRVAEDLEQVATLGFRGEALPSIASVSKIKLTTRRRGDEYGRLVELHAGKLVRDEEAGCPFGTVISVSELFYNLPARYKFLKKDAAEAAQISELTGRLAIGRPDISFTLTTQSAQILHTQSGGKPGDAIFAVFGKDIYEGLTPIRPQSSARAGYSVSGFAGKPYTARANRNYQLFYVNGRLVKNRIIMAAVEEAYKTHIPGRRFPVVVLYIDMDASLVDVNAHPAKTEVRFQSESDLFRAVYHAVASSLREMDIGAGAAEYEDRRQVLQTGAFVNENAALQAGAAGFERLDSDALKSVPVQERLPEPAPVQTRAPVSGNAAAAENAPVYGNAAAYNPASDNAAAAAYPPPSDNAAAAYTPTSVYTPSLAPEDAHILERAEEPERRAAPEQAPPGTAESADRGAETETFEAARYIGQIFGTYLAFEINNTLLMIDQHAAHERMLYERIKTQYEKNAVARQLLLESITVNLLPDEMLFVIEAAPLLKKAGFAYEEFGREAVVLREAPLYMEHTDVREFFLESVEIFRRNRVSDAHTGGAAAPYDSLLYDIACKAAVKGNSRLTAGEAIELLRALDGLPKPLTCPHGRPLITAIPKRELDRRFKRI